MRKITATINLLFLLAIGILTTDNRNFLYPTTCIITEIDETKDLVTISTCTGLEYQFYGIEDYDTGDLVSVLFFGGLTEKVTDDVIIFHRYSGWPELFEEFGEK